MAAGSSPATRTMGYASPSTSSSGSSRPVPTAACTRRRTATLTHRPWRYGNCTTVLGAPLEAELPVACDELDRTDTGAALAGTPQFIVTPRRAPVPERDVGDEAVEPQKDPGRQILDDSRPSEARREPTSGDEDAGPRSVEQQIEDLPASPGGL